jgi:SAM-dependent methyltransferase
MSNQIQKYWSSVNSSSHRQNNIEFYNNNAREHISLIDNDDIDKEFIDLGCGAGKILQYYKKELNYIEGLDSSVSMISEAKKLLNKSIKLVHADPFDYLPNCKIPIWTTCGALNQYLNNHEVEKFLHLFKKNQYALSLYMFETICPIRYSLLTNGISFRQQHLDQKLNFKLKCKNKLKKLIFAFYFSLGKYSKDTVYLNSPVMGYGHSPSLWHKLGEKYDLKIDIIGSKYYEYRYHVILRKF